MLVFAPKIGLLRLDPELTLTFLSPVRSRRYGCIYMLLSLLLLWVLQWCDNGNGCSNRQKRFAFS